MSINKPRCRIGVCCSHNCCCRVLYPLLRRRTSGHETLHESSYANRICGLLKRVNQFFFRNLNSVGFCPIDEFSGIKRVFVFALERAVRKNFVFQFAQTHFYLLTSKIIKFICKQELVKQTTCASYRGSSKAVVEHHPKINYTTKSIFFQQKISIFFVAKRRSR